MRFVVRRTSEWGHTKPPCDGAQKVRVGVVDRRTAPAHKLPGGAPAFLAEGIDHKLLKTVCSRVLPIDAWVMDCDIQEFVFQHGECVVTPPGCGRRDWVPPMWTVEIYDGYRE